MAAASGGAGAGGGGDRCFDERVVDCKSIRAAGVMKARVGDETADKYE